MPIHQGTDNKRSYYQWGSEEKNIILINIVSDQ